MTTRYLAGSTFILGNFQSCWRLRPGPDQVMNGVFCGRLPPAARSPPPPRAERATAHAVQGHERLERVGRQLSGLLGGKQVEHTLEERAHRRW